MLAIVNMDCPCLKLINYHKLLEFHELWLSHFVSPTSQIQTQSPTKIEKGRKGWPNILHVEI